MMPKLALSLQPKGYLEYCDIIEEIEKTGNTYGCQVLVTDSITSLIAHLKRLICFVNKKTSFTFDEWAILLNNLEEYLVSMMQLQRYFKHVITIAHEMVEKDEETGRILSILPAIEGSMRYKISKDFTEVYRTFVDKGPSGKAVYQIYTQAIDKAEARTGRDLPPICPADFGIIYADEKVQ